MKTGRYRVRKGWFGRAILQAEYDSPSFIAGHVAADVRDIYWDDCKYDKVSHLLFGLLFKTAEGSITK